MTQDLQNANNKTELKTALDEASAMFEKVCSGLAKSDDVDKRALAIAKTHFDTGMLWLNKAVLK